MKINFHSRQPIYEQLVEKIKQSIIENILNPDDKLPSVRELASQLTVTPNTVQKAYRELEHKGYIYSLPGKGSFVKYRNPTRDSEKINSIKVQVIRLVKEGIFYGMTQEECVSVLEDLYSSQKEKG